MRGTIPEPDEHGSWEWLPLLRLGSMQTIENLQAVLASLDFPAYAALQRRTYPLRTEADLDFIRMLPLTIRLPDHANLLLVHAGLVPGRPPLEQAWHTSTSDRCNMLSRSCESRTW